MMNSIKYLLLAILTGIIILSVGSCINPQVIGDQLTYEEYNVLCPFDRKYGGLDFYLEVPLFIEPNQQTYKVGDTINFRLEVTDDIKDLSRDEVFKITNFPFKPSFELYRIDSSGWVTGYDGNAVAMDTIYNPRVIGASPQWSTNIRGWPTYIDGRYFLEMQLILHVTGRYVHLVGDVIEAVKRDFIGENYYPEYLDISNDSGCPLPHDYTVCYVLQGEPYYEEFAEELTLVDEEVKLDQICGVEGVNDHIWGGGGCRIPAEFSGIFGFEVVE